MESVTLDDMDRRLLHALRLDGRAPFQTLATVLGGSDRTLARRYRRLRAAGVARVVGVCDRTRLGHVPWTVRFRCTPDAALAVGEALARRADTFWVHLLSGGTEISCHVMARTPQERDALLFDKLPRTHRVSSVSAHAVLAAYATPFTWAGTDHLSEAELSALREIRPSADLAAVAAGLTLSAPDDRLLDAVALDGRAGHAELAAATGWSASSVRRRLDALREAGVLRFVLDISLPALGFRAEARLWMSVPPAALDETARSLARHPEATFVAATTGPTNLVAGVSCRDITDLHRYLTDRVGALEQVRHLESAPVIRTLKRGATS